MRTKTILAGVAAVVLTAAAGWAVSGPTRAADRSDCCGCDCCAAGTCSPGCCPCACDPADGDRPAARLVSAVVAADDRHAHHGHGTACAKACDDCARACDACGAHCAALIADGKKEHLASLRTCQDCATVCRAAAAVVARSGPFTDLLCTACADACKRCGEECRKHADPMMKQCAEECRKCEAACRDMLKHGGAK